MTIEHIAIVFSIALGVVGAITGLLSWYSNSNRDRLKPQVDAMGITGDAQTIAKTALEGQLKLTQDVEDLKKQLKGRYEIRVIVSFFPELTVHEASMKQLQDCELEGEAAEHEKKNLRARGLRRK